MPATQVNPLHRTCHVRWNFKGANLLLLHGRAVATAGHSATTSSPCAGRCSLDERLARAWLNGNSHSHRNEQAATARKGEQAAWQAVHVYAPSEGPEAAGHAARHDWRRPAGRLPDRRCGFASLQLSHSSLTARSQLRLRRSPAVALPR